MKNYVSKQSKTLEYTIDMVEVVGSIPIAPKSSNWFLKKELAAYFFIHTLNNREMTGERNHIGTSVRKSSLEYSKKQQDRQRKKTHESPVLPTR